MRHFKRMACAVLLTALLLVGGAAQAGAITAPRDMEGKIVAMMAIPIPAENMKASIEADLGVPLKEVAYYDSFQAAVAALKSGKADAIMALEPVADFYIARDDALTSITLNESDGKASCRMALRSTDTQLLADINAAMASMVEDGTLDALAREFVADLTPDRQLEGRELPHFDDAETLYVGISGDNPPIDYVAADGMPAGFNVELLARLSEALHLNFEISVMPLETKFPALASNKIDIFFFHPISETVEVTVQTMAENEEIALSEAYYHFNSGTLLILK